MVTVHIEFWFSKLFNVTIAIYDISLYIINLIYVYGFNIGSHIAYILVLLFYTSYVTSNAFKNISPYFYTKFNWNITYYFSSTLIIIVT